MKNAIGVDFELNPDAGDGPRRGLEFQRETAETPVVPGPLALALENVNEHLTLLIDGGGEGLAGLYRNRRVARDDDIHQPAEGLDAERERGHIEQQHGL